MFFTGRLSHDTILRYFVTDGSRQDNPKLTLNNGWIYNNNIKLIILIKFMSILCIII